MRGLGHFRQLGVVLADAPQPVEHAVDKFSNVIVWMVLGLVFLWVVSFLGGVVMQHVKPVLPFLIAAMFVGILVSAAFAKL